MGFVAERAEPAKHLTKVSLAADRMLDTGPCGAVDMRIEDLAATTGEGARRGTDAWGEAVYAQVACESTAVAFEARLGADHPLVIPDRSRGECCRADVRIGEIDDVSTRLGGSAQGDDAGITARCSHHPGTHTP